MVTALVSLLLGAGASTAPLPPIWSVSVSDDQVRALAVRPGSGELVVAMKSGVIQIHDTRTGKLLRTSRVGAEVRPGAVWSEDRLILLAAGGSVLQGPDLSFSRSLDPHLPAGKPRLSTCGRWMLVGDALVSTYGDGKTKPLNLPRGGYVRSISRDGALVLYSRPRSGGFDIHCNFPIGVFSTSERRVRWERTWPHGWVESFVFSPDGRRIAVGSVDRYATILVDARDMRKLGVLERMPSEAVWSPSGRWIVNRTFFFDAYLGDTRTMVTRTLGRNHVKDAAFDEGAGLAIAAQDDRVWAVRLPR